MAGAGPPGRLKPSSYSQKLWRFVADERVRGCHLIEPLLTRVRMESQAEAAVAARRKRPAFLLAVHDWSTIHFKHKSKTDRATLTHAKDTGYDLKTTLIVRARDGAAIAPAEVALKAADAVHSTREGEPPPDVAHVDQLLDAMAHAEALDLGPAKLVHVIDREADSVGHWREWTAAEHAVLVRADDRQVLRDGRETTLAATAADLKAQGGFRSAGPALFHGRPARRWVAEADVVLHKPAKRNTGEKTAGGNKKQKDVPGPPLPLRLVVCELRDAEKKTKVLARWLLLTNVPREDAKPAVVAEWYYHRWKIEDMHKLLKGSGWELEGWLQRDAKKIFHKLLLAFAACASIWELMRRKGPEAEEFRELLMQLSGRQAKRRRPFTASALLAGTWVLQAAVGPLARHGPEGLQAMLDANLPLFGST